MALLAFALAGVSWTASGGVSQATVSASVISTARYPLALDVDAAGNVWIGYKDGPMTPKGVTVVPAADGTFFGVSVTAGVETRIFALDSIQGIFMSPGGDLFVSTDAGALYVATETATTVFGTPTTADALTPLSVDGTFSGGLGMDSQGNLFGARKASGGGGVAVFPAVTGLLYGQDVVANVPELLTPAGLPWGGWEGDLALDSQDNLFVNTWFTNIGPQGVYIPPKVSGTLYGQSVTANTLVRSVPFNGVVNAAAGIDIDDSDNVYVSQWPSAIYALSPLTRFVMGQTLTANTVSMVNGSSGYVGEGIAVVPDGSSLISGANSSTVRLTPVPNPPVLSTSPFVSGVADVGETLSANGGTWSGDPAPTISGFQWQTCDVAGPAGVDWFVRQSPTNTWYAVTWGGPPGGELFVAVAGSGTGNRVMTSPDGITWTPRTSAADNIWTSVTWGGPPGAELFVAVAANGTGNRVMTSPDGITWTARASAADNAWYGVTWGGPPGAELFVAVAANGTGNRVMTSPDGITWTAQTSATDITWRSVVWGGPANGRLFVATASGGAGNRVMTSPDGITWTPRASTNGGPSVAWGGPAGSELFVAVSRGGGGSYVVTSPDGITWTPRTATASSWNSVTWGEPSSSRAFVAVSASGSSTAVMTSSSSLTCADVPGATGSTYLIGDSDRGKTLRVQATATNISGSASALSSGLGPVPNPAAPPAPPRYPPGPPVAVTATATLRGADVRWTPPADPGTDGVSLYAVRAWPGGPACQVPASNLSCTVAGLDPQQDYYFTVVAMNGAGWGSASQPSNTIRPLTPELPGAPTNVVATPSDAQASVSWTPPSRVGSSPIREYRVSSIPAGGSCTSTAADCTVTGLVNDTSYSFMVEARNDEGWGPASQASAAVTPRAPSVTVSAQRSGRLVELTGVTTSIAPGSVATVWWRFGGQGTFAPSSVSVRVDQAGAFAWQRRMNPAKRVEVYATVIELPSNTVVLPAKRSR